MNTEVTEVLTFSKSTDACQFLQQQSAVEYM